MKKLIAAILTLALAVSVTACGGTTQNTQTAQTSAASSKASSVSAEPAASEDKETTADSTAAASSSEQGAAEQTSAAAETSATSESSSGMTYEPVKEIPIVDEELPALECVELGNYKGLKVTDVYVAPTQENVDSYINSLLTAIPVEDENALLKEGDIANIDFEGKIDGVAFDGGTAAGYDLTIGSGTFMPGFEDQMIGMKKGEVRDVPITIPEDYSNTDIAGKDAVFTVTLNEIKVKPELNDEWVQTYSGTECKTVEEFRKFMMDYFEKTAKSSAKSAMQRALWEQVVANSTVNKIPKSYFEKAKENFDKLSENDAAKYGLTLEEYIETAGMTQENYDSLKDSYAKDSAKNTILGMAVWDEEKMTKESKEYVETLEDLCDSTGMTMDELLTEFGEETLDDYGKNSAVLERIMSYANVVSMEETTEESAEKSE